MIQLLLFLSDISKCMVCSKQTIIVPHTIGQPYGNTVPIPALHFRDMPEETLLLTQDMLRAVQAEVWKQM